MKKGSKIILSFALIFVTLISFVACSTNAEKTFTCDAGLTIKLTNAFKEKEVVSQTYYLESRNIIFLATKEEYTLLESNSFMNDPSTKTKEDYAELIKTANNITAQVTSDSENDLVYFSYEKSVSGNTYYYFAVIEKGTDAFWLCQFACLSRNKDSMQSKFIEYAKTITVI